MIYLVENKTEERGNSLENFKALRLQVRLGLHPKQ